MSNIVSLFSNKEKPADESFNICEGSAPKEIVLMNQPLPEALDYIRGFYDWAQEKGIPTDTMEFKYDAAVILTAVQGMLMKAKK